MDKKKDTKGKPKKALKKKKQQKKKRRKNNFLFTRKLIS